MPALLSTLLAQADSNSGFGTYGAYPAGWSWLWIAVVILFVLLFAWPGPWGYGAYRRRNRTPPQDPRNPTNTPVAP